MGFLNSLFKSLLKIVDINEMKREKDINGLIKTLRHGYWKDRFDAIKALSEVGLEDKRTTVALINSLHDSDESVRRAAIDALGNIGEGDPKIGEALLNYLKIAPTSDYYPLRDALLKLKEPRAIIPIVYKGEDRYVAPSLISLGLNINTLKQVVDVYSPMKENLSESEKVALNIVRCELRRYKEETTKAEKAEKAQNY